MGKSWEDPVHHTFVPRFAIALAILLLPVIAFSEDEKGPKSVASGRVESKEISFEVGDAYAFRGKGFDDDKAIRVALSNSHFHRYFVDRYWDRSYFVNEFFAKQEDVLVLWLEFSPEGKYRGLSYYFEPGNGCGWCSNGEATSTVVVKDGRLIGKVASKEDDRSVDVTLDVPIASDDRGQALGAGGGAPGKVYTAFHEALIHRDDPALKNLFAAERVERWGEYEKQGDGDAWVNVFLDEHHAQTLHVTEAYVKGDEALVLVEGEHPSIGKVKGEALLSQENGSWRVLDETFQIGSW